MSNICKLNILNFSQTEKERKTLMTKKLATVYAFNPDPQKAEAGDLCDLYSLV